jgi:hypothetical protein
MDNGQPGGLLNIPITEAERAQAAQIRDDRLIPDVRISSPDSNGPSPESLYDAPPKEPQLSAPSRFPSIHAPRPVKQFGPSFSHRVGIGRQYAPITPVPEEDEPDSIRLRRVSSTSVYSIDETEAIKARLHSGETTFTTDERNLIVDAGPVPPLWTPIWLKRWFLVLFAVLFGAALLVLVLLWHFDEVNDGFYVKQGMGHYAWSYTPTIIVVVVLALWRMVDYHAKLAMPYDALQDGPIKPSESLLVDYISKFQLVSLFEAFRNSHFAVVTSVTGFVLLKVVTVFSTGLLVALPTQVAEKGASLQAKGFSANTSSSGSGLSDSASLVLPVYSYFGSAVQGSPFENGVTSSMAYSMLSVDSKKPIDNATIIGIVDVFQPSMSCTTLDVDLTTPRVVNDTNVNTAFATSSNITFNVAAGGLCAGPASVVVPADNPFTEILPGRQVTGTLQKIFCGSSNVSAYNSGGPQGVLFTMTDISNQQKLFDNATDLSGGSFAVASGVSRTISKITNVFCKPSYLMTRGELTNDTRLAGDNQAVSIVPKDGGDNNNLAGFSDWNATSVLTQASLASQVLFGDVVNDDSMSASSAIFQLMAATQGSQNIESLLNPNTLTTAAIATYKGVMAQFAHQSLRAVSTTKVDGGKITRLETRLRINDASVWTMASACGFLVLFSIALVAIAPRAVVPRDPGTIAAVATTLVRSTELNRLLRKQGASSYQNQKSALAGFEFGTAIATMASGRSAFKIVTSEGTPSNVDRKSKASSKWWLPISASIPFFGLTIVLPLATFVALELIQRRSDDHDGLYTVTDDRSTEIFSHYIPGTVTLLLAALINRLDFNVALFTPWNYLAKGNAPYRRSLINNILGRSPPYAFLQALRTRSLGAMLSIGAATAASMLTVVVSGLYYVEHYTNGGASVTLRQTDLFDLSKWTDSFSNDNGAAAMTNLIMHQNIGFPQSTFEGLVFPKLALNNSALTTNDLVTVKGLSSHVLPALQANLKCDVLGSNSIDLATEAAGDQSAYSSDMAFVTVRANLPDSCHLGGTTGTDDFILIDYSFELASGGGATFAGAQLDLLFGQGADTFGNSGEARGAYISDNPAVACPSLAFTFGKFQLNSQDTDQITTMVCYQQIQGLNANVTFLPNSTTINPSQPPVIDQSSIFEHENPLANNSGIKTFDFRIQNNLAQEMTLFNGQSGTPTSNPSSTSTFDIFFQAIINGSSPLTPASLAGPKNQDILVSAITKFYQVYMAQAISLNMRVPLSNNTTTLHRRQSQPILTTLTTSTNTPRLVQDRPTKIFLQALLLIMTILAALSWTLTKFRHVLPCNPCSIAGTMSLLAGSDLVYHPDDGVCECCGKSRRRSFGDDANRGVHDESIHAGLDEVGVEVTEGVEHEYRTQIIDDGAEWFSPSHFNLVFAGKRYSMGWWRENRAIGKRRRYGVDVGERPDGNDDGDWDLGPRRNAGTASGFQGFMTTDEGRGRGRGDRDGRGVYGHARNVSVGGDERSPDPNFDGGSDPISQRVRREEDGMKIIMMPRDEAVDVGGGGNGSDLGSGENRFYASGGLFDGPRWGPGGTQAGAEYGMRREFGGEA